EFDPDRFTTLGGGHDVELQGVAADDAGFGQVIDRLALAHFAYAQVHALAVEVGGGDAHGRRHGAVGAGDAFAQGDIHQDTVGRAGDAVLAGDVGSEGGAGDGVVMQGDLAGLHEVLRQGGGEGQAQREAGQPGDGAAAP